LPEVLSGQSLPQPLHFTFRDDAVPVQVIGVYLAEEIDPKPRREAFNFERGTIFCKHAIRGVSVQVHGERALELTWVGFHQGPLILWEDVVGRLGKRERRCADGH